MSTSIFITATDTGAGKTHVSCALLLAIRRRSLLVQPLKAVASGSQWRGDIHVSEDAERLRAYASVPAADMALISPMAFVEPIAPELAAAHEGRRIELAPILGAYAALSHGTDAVVVEGVGGWCVPYAADLMQADLVRSLSLPVVLVVGIRLGCINHALLSARAIAADGCTLVGWIANRVDAECAYPDAVIANLAGHLGQPPLADLPHSANVDLAAARLAPLLDRMGWQRKTRTP